MDFSTIAQQLENTKARLKNISGNVDKEAAKEIVVNLTSEKKIKNVYQKNKESIPLDRQKFEEILEGYDKCSIDELQIGSFIRYKYKKDDGTIKYVFGGMLVYKCPDFLRVKNVQSKITWSVKLNQPIVFYQKKKLQLEKGGMYVNLNTASTPGLLAAIIDRGDHEALEKAAKIAKKNAIKQSLS